MFPVIYYPNYFFLAVRPTVPFRDNLSRGYDDLPTWIGPLWEWQRQKTGKLSWPKDCPGFPDCSKGFHTFLIVWTVSRLSGQFHTVWKLSRLCGQFPNYPDGCTKTSKVAILPLYQSYSVCWVLADQKGLKQTLKTSDFYRPKGEMECDFENTLHL